MNNFIVVERMYLERTGKAWPRRLLACLLVVGILVVTSGCAAIVREKQRRQSQSASRLATIGNQTFSVFGEVWLEGGAAKQQNMLHGKLSIVSQPGSIPPDVNLYHFQIITKGGGLRNYSRGKDGTWRTINGQPLNVKLQRDGSQMTLEFALSDWANKPQSFDIAISLSDGQLKKHILLASNLYAANR